MRPGTSLGAAEGTGRNLGVVAAVPPARLSLDVPIETKVHAPGWREEWVKRPELTERLAHTATRLVLVDAPAGFGKTTVIAQWRCSTADSRAFAWVSLDGGDDDPGRLWWYVVSALKRACAELDADDILHELRTQAPEITARVLPALANELAALSRPVVLVLDDYHVIKQHDIHDQLAFLLLHLPPTAQVVLITRADPPLPLARMRAAGEMVEFGARDLRFTSEEVAGLVRFVSGIRLAKPDVTDLMERTEGWPAGVYLAALSLRGHSSPHDFVRQFTGDNRFIVDFLADEVLSRQPGEIQQFLTRTSILARFCPSLCDAVTGSADSAAIIKVLERENLFVVPLDDNRHWYRYRKLFAQLLRSRLAASEPGIVATLNERASAWHQQSGSAEEAISHALAAGSPERATDLISQYWYGYVNVGRTATVSGWMRSIGEDQIAANPLAAHVAAWAAALSGDRESLRRWLPVIDAADHDGPLPDGIQSLKSSAALLRSVFGFEGLKVMREAATIAAELETDPKSQWYALAKGALGHSLYLSGDPSAAAELLEDAVQSESSFPLIHMMALSVLSLVTSELGRLTRAQELAEEARELASRSDISRRPQSSLAYTATGAVYAARGRLDQARSELEHALEIRRRVLGISQWSTLTAMMILARVLVDLGDRASAGELAAEARDVLAALPDGTEALQARLAELDRRIAGRPREPGEPLTEREVAVLRLLGVKLSLREIGLELYLSANTIKSHTQAIYRKLGVSTRHDAVERGKQLGIR